MNTIIDFQRANSVDTCSIWNLLSAQKLSSTVFEAGFELWATGFVVYEAIDKPRKNCSPEEEELKSRFKHCLERQDVKRAVLDIEDLKAVSVLEGRKRLGKGELSGIVFAGKYGLAFLTDDQKARKLAGEYLGIDHVQTVPRLFGSLFYQGLLLDGDKDEIILEHESMGRPLKSFMQQCYEDAMHQRLYNGCQQCPIS